MNANDAALTGLTTAQTGSRVHDSLRGGTAVSYEADREQTAARGMTGGT